MTASPLAYARRYGELGFHVFPCDIVMRDGKLVKQPMIAEWQLRASTDPDQLAEWWARWPGAMVGMAHRLTGTIALDLDRKDGRDGGLALIQNMLLGRREVATPAFRSATGGLQRIYARPVDLAALSGNYPGALGAGLDVIAGYSVLPSGGATPGREWTPGRTPGDLPPAGCPDWIIEPLRKREDEAAALAILPRPAAPSGGDVGTTRYVAAALDGEIEAIRALAPGGRQDGLHVAACNVGRACGRAGRSDLAGWCADALASAAGWANTRHERATIARGIEWGLTHA